MAFNLYSELGKQQSGAKVALAAPGGQVVTLYLRKGVGNTAFHMACEEEKKQRERERRSRLGLAKAKSTSRALQLQQEATVSPGEYQQIQREQASGRLLLGFEPAEWEGLEVNPQNLAELLRLDWIWSLVRDWCLLDDDSVEAEREEAEAAEKKSGPSGGGSSATDTEPATSGPASKSATPSTKSK